MTNLDSVLKSRDITVKSNISIVKAMVFPVVMYRCESWTIKKNWFFQTVVLEKTLETPLDCKEVQPAHPKGNQPWIFFGRTDAEEEALIFCLPDVKNWLIGKDSDAGKDWRQEEKEAREDEIVAWHHQLNGHTFEPGVLQFMGSQRVGHYLVTEQ